jgi:hypothetical protein
LRELAIKQQGVVRRDQLAELGLSRHVVESMLDSGRWRAQAKIIVVMHNGPMVHSQKLWAAVLNAGQLMEVALAARTAATEFGLKSGSPRASRSW